VAPDDLDFTWSRASHEIVEALFLALSQVLDAAAIPVTRESLSADRPPEAQPPARSGGRVSRIPTGGQA
jgi:hypothetical protein